MPFLLPTSHLELNNHLQVHNGTQACFKDAGEKMQVTKQSVIKGKGKKKTNKSCRSCNFSIKAGSAYRNQKRELQMQVLHSN